ncbi:MAG TPA: DsbA family protein [Puia sp.]|nr:DsbA family protein [Puia sp.]
MAAELRGLLAGVAAGGHRAVAVAAVDDTDMTPTIYYCYDAYCGWCYGFSPVITRIFVEYRSTTAFEVLSGGMILPERPQPIGVMAGYIQKAYKTVEERTGIRFGEDWRWHIFHPEESDWYPSSEKPAIAMCVFREYHPDLCVPFSADLQYALHYEGRDLTDDEAYRHLVEKYSISEREFYDKLRDPVYKAQAYEEFALVQQLNVTGFPTVFLQVSDKKFYLLSRGYTDYTTLKNTLDKVLAEVGD